MNLRCFGHCHLLAKLCLLTALGFPGVCLPQPPPPVPPNPQAPTLAVPVPVGMQRGTTLELTLAGTNLADPTGLWTSFPAKVTIPSDHNNGKDAGKLRVRLEVPKEAPLGFHSIRLATKRGLSNLRLFCIDDLPQVQEVDSNHSKSTAQTVPVPCVVVGRSDPEVSDYFKINVKAGQRISFEVLGRRLGSALDPQISLIDPRSQRALAFNNDSPGLQTDPRLTYTFKEAGDYLIEVSDTRWAGGPDFWYRLRIGDFPCATTPIPMAARRGSKVTVHFAGPVVDGVAPVEVNVPNDPMVNTIWVTPRGPNGLYGWPVALAVSDLDEAVEQEPNNEPAKANRIPVPGGITGRFQEKGDVDYYVFQAKKGQRYIIRAHTHELYSPTDVRIVLHNAKGDELAITNPQAPPPTDQSIDFTAPADEDFRLEAYHINYWGGPSEAYRLTVTPYQQGFTLSLGIDRYDVPQGGTTSLSLFAVRRDYTGPIEVSVLGPPGFSGQTTIPAGQPAAPNQPAALLFLSAKPDLPLGPYTITIQGKADINGKPVVAYASLRAVISREMAGLPFPPRQLLNQVGLAVTERPPFSLIAKPDQPEAIRAGPLPLTITAVRAAGFTEEIAIAPIGLPPTIPPAAGKIAKGQNDVKISLSPAANAPLGHITFSFNGTAKFQNRDFTVTALPADVTLTLPFELKIEPAPLKLTPGAKAKLKIIAVRKGSYQGSITVELRNLPANVTASKATITMGQSAVEIEIAAAPTAAPATKGDVSALGTATAAANQQNVSPNFTVMVMKK